MKTQDYKKELTDYIHKANSNELNNFLTSMSEKSKLLKMEEATQDNVFSMTRVFGVDSNNEKFNVKAITLHNTEMNGLDINGLEEKIDRAGTSDFYSFITRLKGVKQIEQDFNEHDEFSSIALIEKDGIKIPILIEGYDEDTTTFNPSQKLLNPNDVSDYLGFDFNKEKPYFFNNLVSAYSEAMDKDVKDVEKVFNDIYSLQEYVFSDAKRYRLSTLDLRDMDEFLEGDALKGVDKKDMEEIYRHHGYEKTFMNKGDDYQNKQRLFSYVAIDVLDNSGEEEKLKELSNDLNKVKKRKDRGMDFSP